MRLLIVFLTGIFFASSAFAQHYSRPDDMEYFKKLEAVPIQPDMGYLLVRLGENSKGYEAGFSMIRKLKDTEIQAYEAEKKIQYEKAKLKNEKKREKRQAAKAKAEAKGEAYTKSIPPVLTYDRFVFPYEGTKNVYVVDARKEYTKTDYGRVMVIQLKPGNYVISDIAAVCMCMGTVQFEIKPGVINDLGMIVSDLADRYDGPSKYPDIWEAVKDHGVYRTGIYYLVSTIRPATNDMDVPEPLQALPRELVELHAMGKMPVYYSTMVDRMVAIPGILGYEGDQVVDLRTGQVLE